MSTAIQDKSKSAAAEVMVANLRAYVAIKSAYDQCDPSIREAVEEMFAVVGSPEATTDEQNRALVTIVDALFPSMAVDFLDVCERIRKLESSRGLREHMRQEEASFANNVQEIMAERKMTQDDLAALAGVGQSAISNMLNRNSRPQRRTVVRIAGALGVEPSRLWQGIEDGELG